MAKCLLPRPRLSDRPASPAAAPIQIPKRQKLELKVEDSGRLIIEGDDMPSHWVMMPLYPILVSPQRLAVTWRRTGNKSLHDTYCRSCAASLLFMDGCDICVIIDTDLTLLLLVGAVALLLLILAQLPLGLVVGSSRTSLFGTVPMVIFCRPFIIRLLHQAAMVIPKLQEACALH